MLPSTDRNQSVLNTFEGGFVMAFRRSVRVLCLLIIVSLVALPLLAANGRISGRITRSDGSGIGGVIVQVVELSRAIITESDGAFVLDVPPGTYTLNFVAGDQATTESNVVVTDGATTRVDKQVDWRLSIAETITVYSASRRDRKSVV